MGLCFSSGPGGYLGRVRQRGFLDAQEILSKFNLVTTGGVSTGSDIVGNTLVGGTLNGASFFAGGSNVPASPVLNVYGSINSSSTTNINAGGDLFYNGTISTPSHPMPGFPQVNFNGGGQQKPLDTMTNPLSDYTWPLYRSFSTSSRDLTGERRGLDLNGDFDARVQHRNCRVQCHRVTIGGRPRQQHHLQRHGRHRLHHRCLGQLHRTGRHEFELAAGGCDLQLL